MSTCCQTSVGVVITDRTGRLLMITRSDGTGIAPVAGHVRDEHASWAEAARAEVAQETGLTVVSLEDTGVGGWRPNRCGRPDPGPGGPGHEWRIYRASVVGDLTPSRRETLGARWYTPVEVQALADRTIEFGIGLYTAEERDAAEPGLEPVWVEWLADLGLIDATPTQIAFADRLTRPAPTRTWAIDFHATDGVQVLYLDMSARRRLALVGLLAETDPSGVISLPAATTPTGPRTRYVLRVGRITNLRPAEDDR